MTILGLYFGWPAGAVWSNLLASAICAGVVWWRLHRQGVRQHAEQLAAAARQHFALLAQAEDHHQAQVKLAEKHQEQVLARADEHHQALRAHLSAELGRGGGM